MGNLTSIVGGDIESGLSVRAKINVLLDLYNKMAVSTPLYVLEYIDPSYIKKGSPTGQVLSDSGTWIDNGTQNLASVLSNDNKTGGSNIVISLGDLIKDISGVNYVDIQQAGAVEFGTTNGYFFIDASKSEIVHVNSIEFNSPLTTVNSDTTVNGYFNAISNDGNSSIVVEDGDVYSQWTNGLISSCQNNDSNESSLNFYNGSVGFTAFIKAKEFSNDIFHSFKNTFSSPINEFTYGGIYFVSGIGIDSTVTAGTDVLNIGATNANVINYGNASTIHNFLGTAIYELQVNSYVDDKLITLNYGGAVGSGVGVGFEIEENSVITGYLKTNSARNGFSILTPAIAYKADLNLDLLTADRTYSLPNGGGVLALESFVDSKVTDAIVGGITTVAPSQNAVYNALLLKSDANSFIDITSSCTIVGWSFYTTNSIRSVDMGDYYIVTGYITGTSNSTTTSVQLPYTNNGYRQADCSYGVNNGTSLFIRIIINGASDTIDFKTTAGGNVWTNTGTKEVDFCLVIEK